MADGDSVSSGDSFTETTSTGWLSRIGGALKGVLVGLVLAVVAFPLLFWNEGRAVRTARSLDEGRGAVVSVSSESVRTANEGKLVHTSGRAKTSDTVIDPLLGVSVNALRLKRNVEMYQWKESSKSESREKFGGGTDTVTTYTYQREWSNSLVDSSAFRQSTGHQNPASMPIKSDAWSASKVTLGAYVLSPAQVERIGGDEAVVANAVDAGAKLGRPLREYGGILYTSKDPASPQVGDVRIGFAKVGETDLTVVARQVGNTFEPYRAQAGSTVELQQNGIASADAMFARAEEENVILTWILRAAGVALMAIGIGLVLRPLSVLASVLPFLGSVVAVGTGSIACLLAGVLSLGTIGIAWIFYRPLLGIALLAIGAALAYAVLHLTRKASLRATQPS